MPVKFAFWVPIILIAAFQVTGYQLRTCDWVGSAKFQFTSFAEGAAGDSMSHTDQDRQENVLDASPDQEHTISEGGSWAASHTSEEAEAALAFSDDDVMQLNVGGTMFMTTRRTLTQVLFFPCKVSIFPVSSLQAASQESAALGSL